MDTSPSVVGTYGQGVIASRGATSSEHDPELEFVELVSASRRDLTRKPTTQRKSLELKGVHSSHEIIHASIQYLDKVRSTDKRPPPQFHGSNHLQQWTTSSSTVLANPSFISSSVLPPERFALLTTVRKEVCDSKEYYSASLFLLLEKRGSLSQGSESGQDASKTSQLRKVKELVLINKSETIFHAHLLPPHKRPVEEKLEDVDATEVKVPSFKNRVVILNLDANVMLFTVETFTHDNSSQAQIELLSSELVTRSFGWAQWIPQYQFLVFAHDRKVPQSTFDEEDAPSVVTKPMLSILQFHSDFPRESVLNMPLDVDTKESGESYGRLVQDPNIITSKSVQLKMCAHASGAVYLFSIQSQITQEFQESDSSASSSKLLKYSVNLLHHNKTLDVQCDLEGISSLPLKMDVSVFANDQYLAVVGWPSFIHLLDVGVTHEPSHQITLDFNSFTSMSQVPIPSTLDSPPFLMILPSSGESHGVSTATSEDKLAAFTLSFATEDGSLHQVQLQPAKLHQLLEKKSFGLKEKLAIIHYILVHVGDINVCKRIIYDEGKRIGNLSLTKVYQEFLVGAAYAQTKKQLLPNMEPFLSLIPYCPNLPSDQLGNHGALLTELRTNWTEVCSMLLSPSQRVFPHNVSDVWTSLWHMNKQLSRSNRFSHKNVADKLLLALQCYKPEALSKASTPMSPSSPMVCASLGDIAGLFGRRTTELQLPFVEHESCTANKQEYIFSINLRELSMHLLKERKEYPLLGHTVAGKYVSAMVDTARLLCHLACLTVHLQPTKNRDKGYRLIDCLEWETKLRLYMLFEHYALALGKLACPLPQGFTPFFAYLAYKVISFDQFLWHFRAGTFELQIDLVKTIMADLKDAEDENISKKLRLLSLLPKSRAYRILNSWSHPVSVSLRARQHSSDLLSGTISQTRKSTVVSSRKKKFADTVQGKTNITALDSFFQLLTGKASATDIDLGLLTEATMLSMGQQRE